MTEKYLYNSGASELFYGLLETMHDEYSDKMIMAGADLITTDIEEIKMTRLGHSMSLCRRIIGGFQNITPDIYLALEGDETRVEIDCVITYINDDELVEFVDPLVDSTYMLQTVYDYPYPKYCLVSVWDLGETTIEQINNLWMNSYE